MKTLSKADNIDNCYTTMFKLSETVLETMEYLVKESRKIWIPNHPTHGYRPGSTQDLDVACNEVQPTGLAKWMTMRMPGSS